MSRIRYSERSNLYPQFSEKRGKSLKMNQSRDLESKRMLREGRPQGMRCWGVQGNLFTLSADLLHQNDNRRTRWGGREILRRDLVRQNRKHEECWTIFFSTSRLVSTHHRGPCIMDRSPHRNRKEGFWETGWDSQTHIFHIFGENKGRKGKATHMFLSKEERCPHEK